MKRTLAIILAVLMCFSVMASCGAKENGAETISKAESKKMQKALDQIVATLNTLADSQ